MSFDLKPGEIFALLGPNGAGKTTIVRLLQGALQPTTGTVSLHGVPSSDPAYAAARQAMGVVPQQPGMYDDLTLAEFLEVVRRVYGSAAAPQLTQALDLGAYLDRRLSTLSGGLQRRASLAFALLPSPDVLILDEPTAGLDPVASRAVRHLLRQAMDGRTTLLCTHNLAEAETLCETAIILRSGRVMLHDHIAGVQRRLGTRIAVAAAQGPEVLSEAMRESGYPPDTSTWGAPEEAPSAVPHVLVATTDPERDVPAMLRALITRGIDVFEARVVRPTLEDLFFRILDSRLSGDGRTPHFAGIVAGLASGSSVRPPAPEVPVGWVARPASSGQAVRALIWKEFRQLPRKRGALASAILLPLLFLVVMPLGQMLGMSNVGPDALPSRPLPPMMPESFRAISNDPRQLIRVLLLPLSVTLGGLIVPSMLASYTVVIERERRTLDLLVALPVTLASILRAKLLAILTVAAGIAGPLVVVDLTAALVMGFINPLDAAGLVVLLLAGLGYSTAVALLLSLLAGDFRTANNLAGAFIGPIILITLALHLLLPAPFGTLAMSAVFLALAVAAVLAATRFISTERLLR